MKKIFLIILTSLIIILITSIIFIKFTGNRVSNEDDKFSNLFSEKESEECWKFFSSIRLGRWLYIDPEEASIDKGIFIEFLDDATFKTNAWGGTSIEVEGNWEFSDRFLILDFRDENNYWNGINESEFNETYKDQEIELRDKSNILIVPISYIERTEDYDGTCKGTNFFINMAGYYLYKSDIE